MKLSDSSKFRQAYPILPLNDFYFDGGEMQSDMCEEILNSQSGKPARS